MDPTFVGKWQLDKPKTTGFEEFAKAMGFTPETIEIYKKLDYVISIKMDGNKVVSEVDFKGTYPNVSHTVALGETIDYVSIQKKTVKLTVTASGGAIVESYQDPETKGTWTVTRTVKGDVMAAVTKFGTTEMTSYLNRV